MYYLVNIDAYWEGLEAYGDLFLRSRDEVEIVVSRERFIGLLDELALIAQDNPIVQCITNVSLSIPHELMDTLDNHWIVYVAGVTQVDTFAGFRQLLGDATMRHTLILFSPKRGLAGYVPATHDND